MADNVKGTPVKFKIGDYDAYESLTNKDEGTIYFVTKDNNRRIYIGDKCYNISVVTDINDSVVSNETVFSSLAVKSGLNSKVSMCTMESSSDTTLPATVYLQNNHEYRFTNLAGATGIQVDTTDDYTHYLFYCSIVLYEIDFSDTVENFVTVPAGSNTVIRFLNGDTNLSGMDTVELLFFANGMDICCIAAAYAQDDGGV